MAEIKAFVGHSFTEGDDDIVRSFLSFFDTIKGMLAHFEWKHARVAEPKELAAKVLELSKDCNTFIAICTRKELVVSSTALQDSRLRPNSRIVAKSDLEWKTSDWIIQEIGLAIGRDMSVIILLEDGCRRPGGLQGDVEFIPFNRESPEKAQRQILEMLTSLHPDSVESTQTTRSAPKDSPEEEKGLDGAASEQKPRTDPDDSWDKDRFDEEIFLAIARKELERVEQINEAFLSSRISTGEEQKAEWAAMVESWQFIVGEGGQLAKLKRLAVEFPRNGKIQSHLGDVLQNLGEGRDAIEAYRIAAEVAENLDEKNGHLASIAFLEAKGGHRAEAYSYLDAIRQSDVPFSTEERLPNLMKRIGKEIGDDHLGIEAMEAISHSSPADYDNRFALAYAHSQQGNNDLALHHYLAIPTAQRSQIAWNNLGVALQEFRMPGKAVDAYSKAADKGETLAMSNLANKLMDAGFLKLAGEQVSNAISSEDPHRNVGEAFSRLNDIPDEENKTLEEALSNAKNKAEVYRASSQAIQKPNISDLGPLWQAPNCALTVSIDGLNFLAEGEYEVEQNALSAGLFGSQKSKTYQLRLSGSISGRRVYGTIERKPKNDSGLTGLGISDHEKKFLAIFSDDLQSAKVAEGINSRTPHFFDIKCVGSAECEEG